MKIGASSVSSVTHVIVYSGDRRIDAELLENRMREKNGGKAPMIVPDVVWIRSTHMHMKSCSDTRPRIPLWIASEKKHENDEMCGLLQVCDLELDKTFCVVAKKYFCRVLLPDIGLVDLDDVCLIFSGKIGEAVDALLSESHEIVDGFKIEKKP